MSEDKNQLSRDSDLYQKTIRTKVINNLDYESEIKEVSESRHLYQYRGRMSWRSLSEKVLEENLTKRQLKTILNMDKFERAEYFGKTHSHKWKAKGKAEIYIEIKLDIELPDSKTITLFSSSEIKSFKDIKRINSLLSSEASSSKVDLQVKDEDTYVLTTPENFDFELQESLSTNGFGISKRRSCDTEKIISFFRTGKRWAEGTVKKPIEKSDSKISIPVEFEDGTRIEFDYKNPDSNDEFWKISKNLGGGDPLLIGGEDVYITHFTISNRGLFGNNIWTIRSEEPTYSIRLYNRFKDLFGFYLQRG